MKIRHLLHSCLLVEAAGLRLLVDPGGFSPAAAKQTRLDAVLITHQHPDHVDPEALAVLLAANPTAEVIAEPETAEEVASLVAEAPGGRVVLPLAAGQAHILTGLDDQSLRISAHGGRHAVIHPDIPRVGNVGYVLEVVAEDEPESEAGIGAGTEAGAEAGTGAGAEAGTEAGAEAGTGGRNGAASPRLGITGDSLEPIEAFHGIDALAFPVVAPWSKMRETIDFLREVRPRLALPVHDAVASPEGRAIYLRQSTALAPAGTEVRDWPAERVIEL